MESNNAIKDRLTSLAVRMKRGDRNAAAKLYDELLPKAYGFFFTRTGRKETAEDLSQDIFLKLVEKIQHFDERKGSFVVWFWQIARNLLVDHYRGKKTVAFSSFEEGEVEMMSVGEMPDLDSRMRYQNLQHFLKTLGEEERELFELRYVGDASYREIARITGKSEGSLRVAALRVKEKIKKQLGT
jgi:RNA polymerase sigma-70 factor (ECF subfamily)